MVHRLTITMDLDDEELETFRWLLEHDSMDEATLPERAHCDAGGLGVTRASAWETILLCLYCGEHGVEEASEG